MITLESERLHYNPLVMTDIDDVHALHSLPETDRYNTLGIPADIETTRAVMTNWLQQMETTPVQLYVFKLTEKETNTFTGLMGLVIGKPKFRTAEVWYKLHPQQWGKGYATEAVKRVLDLCFNDLQMHRVEAGAAVENIASIKVMENAGMQYEGTKRKVLPIRGEWISGSTYAILEEDYFK